ncbi:hypothetical protein FLJU110815_15915 [Flavobacterium jumunjinense]
MLKSNELHSKKMLSLVSKIKTAYNSNTISRQF